MCWSPTTQPSFTLYRLRFTDDTGTARDIAGVLGGLEVVDEGAGGVLPHERTTPKASTDRLDLTRATAGQPVPGLGTVAGLRAHRAARRAGRAGRRGRPRTASSTWSSGSPIPTGSRAIQQVLAADDVLIADGHHRYGISRTYRDEVRAATGRTDTPAEQTLAFVSELVADQLSVDAIHRLYAGIAPPSSADILHPDRDSSRPTPETLAAMQSRGVPGALHPRPDLAAGPAARALSTASAPWTGPGWRHALGDVPT